MLRKTAIPIAILAFVILVPFAGNYFISDDFELVALVAKEGPFGIWSHPPTIFFRPLVSVTLWLNYATSGWNPAWFYIVNFAIHAANSALVYALASRLWPGARTVPALAAILFAVTPAHAETVFWISCRPDLLATGFTLAALTAFAVAVERASWNWALVSAVFVAIGALCKESVYLVPIIFGVWIWCIRAEGKARRVAIAGALAAAAFVTVAFVMRSQAVTESLPYGTQVGVETLPKIGAKVVLMLIRPVLPFDTQIVAGWAPSPEFGMVDLAVLISVTGLVTLVCFRVIGGPEKVEHSYIAVVVAGFLLTTAPVSMLGTPLLSPENTRFMYLPSSFGLMLISIYIARLSLVKKIGTGLAACSAAFLFTNGVLYRQSSEVCKETISVMQSRNPRAGEVIEVSDNIAGRYTWRNGIEFAVSALAPNWKGVKIQRR